MGKNGTRAAEISVDEAAAVLTCCGETVRRLLAAGELAGWRLTEQGWWRVDAASVKQFMARRKRVRSARKNGRAK